VVAINACLVARSLRLVTCTAVSTWMADHLGPFVGVNIKLLVVTNIAKQTKRTT
jgi:hypothetical protein